MEKKNVYVCGKVGEKKFDVFKALSPYVTFYDSVRELKNYKYQDYSAGHYNGLPTPDYPFDYKWDCLGDLVEMRDMGDPEYAERFFDLVCLPILNSDLVIGYFESPDAFGSLVEIGYALGKGKQVMIVFDDNRCRNEAMIDAYRFLVLMPGVHVYFVDPTDRISRSRLFLAVSDRLSLTGNRDVKMSYLYEGQSGKCNGCLVELPLRNLTIDHVVARKLGGSDEIYNLQLLCQACNSMKNVGTQEDLIRRLVEKGLRVDDRVGELDVRGGHLL